MHAYQYITFIKCFITILGIDLSVATMNTLTQILVNVAVCMHVGR